MASSKVVSSLGHRQHRSNEGILYYNTVQTSWRPQLPLPKEVINAADSNSSEMDKNSKKESTNKKWSFGRLFRKKKATAETDSSSDEDRKAGFISPQKSRKKENKRRGSKIIGAGFDHIVISPKENEIFLPLGHIESASDHTRSTNSLDRRLRREQKRAALLAQYQSSSEDEIKSHNSSSISRYRSDESMGSGGIGIGIGNRKSRSARNERYFKRVGKDENGRSQQQMFQVSQQVGRWNTQPVHIQVHNPMDLDEPCKTRTMYGLKSSASLSSVPITHGASMYVAPPASNWEQQSIQSVQNPIYPVSGDKRSISYDNQIHLQNKSFLEKEKTPPPPPPRDPQRRLNIHQGELRPMSYAFDKTTLPPYAMNGRCVSDDKLWGPNGSIYQSSSLSQRPSSTQPVSQLVSQPVPQQRRFITRGAEHRNSQIGSSGSVGGQDYKYVADAVPRSRKPIHIVNQDDVSKIQSQSSSAAYESPHIIRTTKSGLPATPMQTASDFWKKMEQENSSRRGRETEINVNAKPKPRSISSSRVEEPRSYHSPMLENLYKNQEIFKKQEKDGRYWIMGQHHSRNKSDPMNSFIKREEHTKYGYADEVDNANKRNVFNRQQDHMRPESSFDRRNEDNWLTKSETLDDNLPDNTRKYTRDFENVVNGSLFIKPVKDKNVVEVYSKPDYSKSNSMPNYYQKNLTSTRKPLTPPPDRYDKYTGNQQIQNTLDYNRNIVPPLFKQKASNQHDNTSETAFKSTNLEDAINELEAIYKSLKLGDESLMDRAERRDIPTPTNFEKYAQLAQEYDDDDDDDDEEQTGEPDVVKDDVVYRNIKHANSILKTVEPQPPFGIPLGPVPPSPKTDYLHVTPERDSKKNRCIPHNNIPDIIGDDLAVRTLRKDPPGSGGHPKFVYPSGSLKKKRAARSQSANIYALIQRDAAKPSGGSLYDYYNFEKGVEKSGSMSDVRRETDDIPSTLYLLRNLRDEEQKAKQQSMFRHPSQGGAVYNLPTVLTAAGSYSAQKPPIPLPRKSLSPAPTSELSRSGMEEVLNQIAKEAKESSEKLSRDLEALRKEALLKKSNSRKEKSLSNPKFEKDIYDIEETSKAAKHYEKILRDVVPPQEESESKIELPPRKLEKEKKLLKDISDVSEAAKNCSKMLEDYVVAKHPPIVEVAQTVQQENEKTNDKEILTNIETERLDLNSNKESRESKEIKDINQNDSSSEKSEEGNISEENQLISTKTTNSRNSQEICKNNNDTVVACLLEKIDPSVGKINEIASRCMRQISELSDLTDEPVSSGPDYDNLKSTIDESNSKTCKTAESSSDDHVNIQNTSVVPGQPGQSRSSSGEDDIDKIIKECEYQAQALKERSNSKPSCSTNEENQISDGSCGAVFSSSDCLKSTTSSSSFRHPSSSITSIHAFSSSDYVKSSTSSDTNPPSTDPLKTCSTTSYDVKSSSVTPNMTSTTPSTTPSPPLNLTLTGNAVSGSSNNMSDYNSSEELAMIFGIDQCSPAIAGSTIKNTD